MIGKEVRILSVGCWGIVIADLGRDYYKVSVTDAGLFDCHVSDLEVIE